VFLVSKYGASSLARKNVFAVPCESSRSLVGEEHHISLSRSVAVSYGQIDAFVNELKLQLREALEGQETSKVDQEEHQETGREELAKFRVTLNLTELKVFSNDDNSKCFVALDVEDDRGRHLLKRAIRFVRPHLLASPW